MKQKSLLSTAFAIGLILLGMSFFIDVEFNFIAFISILTFVYALYNAFSKEYLKGAYLFIVSIILLNTSSLINISILSDISWSIAIIGVTLVYLGVKSLTNK